MLLHAEPTGNLNLFFFIHHYNHVQVHQKVAPPQSHQVSSFCIAEVLNVYINIYLSGYISVRLNNEKTIEKLKQLSEDTWAFSFELTKSYLFQQKLISAVQLSHIHYDIRKFSFSNRIIPLWNSLPDNIVSSPTLNRFKARLDKFWDNQDVRYNWKADMLFTGSWSKVELTVD